MGTASEIKAAKFGVFEIDLEARELHRNGLKVRLQEQPYRLLALLVERQGEVVSREELREQLWPADTYVDFDNSLNTAASKLREALGDSAANPRFIETLPRRGYRFLCPVEPVVDGAPSNGQIDGRGDQESPDASPSAVDPNRMLSKRLWRERIVSVTVTALLVIAVGFFLGRQDSIPEMPLRRFALEIPDGSVFPVISPDGRHIAYAANQSLWVQDLDQDAPRKIVDGGVRPRPIAWSPDNQTLAYRTPLDLRIVPLAGGTNFHVAGERTVSVEISWAHDSQSILASGSLSPRSGPGLFRVPVRGGEPKPIPIDSLSESGAFFDIARASPPTAGSPVILGTHRNTLSGSSQVAARNLDTGEEHVLAGGRGPVYSSTGHVIYEALDGSGLWAVPFSTARLEATGEPFLVREKACCASLSREGTLVYVDTSVPNGVQLGRRDVNGKQLGFLGQPQASIVYPAISPDGLQVAASAHERSDVGRDLWIHDVERPSMRRATAAPGHDFGPVWLPSGGTVLYTGQHQGKVSILRKTISDNSDPEVLLAVDDAVFASDVSVDGKTIVYDRHERGEPADIWYLTMMADGSVDPKPFLSTEFEEKAGKLSPNGRWLVYVSNETGAYEVYVQRFPEGGDKQRVSNHGGTGPRWSRDGKKLYYAQWDVLVEVDAESGEELSLGETNWLFEVAGLTRGVSAYPHYDVAPDGNRFVVVEPVGSTTVRVVQNWFAEFRD